MKRLDGLEAGAVTLAIKSVNLEDVPGGIRASAHMRFSSGCDYAEWILLMAPPVMCLVPKADFRVEDDWYVMGLRGTGSKSVVIEEIEKGYSERNGSVTNLNNKIQRFCRAPAGAGCVRRHP